MSAAHSLVSLASLLLALGLAQGQKPDRGDSEAADADTVALELRMIELVNIERDARGIPELRHAVELTRIARSYSFRMAATGKVHHRLDRPMEERVKEVLPATCAFGENVSKHTALEYSVGDLMLSEGHRENILHRDFDWIGVGIASGDDDYLYITQMFVRLCE